MEKSAQRRITLTLPEELLSEADSFASGSNQTRNEFIALAIKQYMRERRRIELKDNMKKGYLEMGNLNLSIAEDSLLSDESAYKIYEEFLSESDECDSKTR